MATVRATARVTGEDNSGATGMCDSEDDINADRKGAVTGDSEGEREGQRQRQQRATVAGDSGATAAGN